MKNSSKFDYSSLSKKERCIFMIGGGLSISGMGLWMALLPPDSTTKKRWLTQITDEFLGSHASDWILFGIGMIMAIVGVITLIRRP